jgi:UDP-perosamine 4-acetyltransferase
VVIEILRAQSGFTIVGLLDAKPELHGQRVLDVPVLGNDTLLQQLRAQGVAHFFVGLGAAGSQEHRRRLYEHAIATGLKPASAVHPSAIVSPSAILGDGIVVMPLAVINAAARVGINVIINTGASVEHDCVLGDHVHIAPGARLASTVRVGDESLVGLGAVVRQLIRIGSRAIIGAGAVVVEDVPPGHVVFGNPARLFAGKPLETTSQSPTADLVPSLGTADFAGPMEYPERYDPRWLAAARISPERVFENCARKLAFIEECLADPNRMSEVSRTVADSCREYDTIQESEHQLYDRNTPIEADICGALLPVGFRQFRDYLANILARRLPTTTGTCLDFGVGNGFNARHLCRIFPSARFTGIDISQSRLDYASQWMGTMPNLQLIQMNGAELQLPDQSYDVVYSCHALEQMESVVEPAVSEIFRVLKPGGRAILLEPVFQHGDIAQRLYLTRYDYLRSLLDALGRHPTIRVVENFTVGIQGNPLNQSSLVVLDKPALKT